MNSTKALLAGEASGLIVGGVGFFLIGLTAHAQIVQHLSITQPGGLPGLPVVTGVQRATNGVTVTWDGPSGYYQLFAKPESNGTWRAVTTARNVARRATLSPRYSNDVFKVSGPSPVYAGAQACLECHQSIHDTEMHTRHAGAFVNKEFVIEGGQTNSSCLPCHTVGYGLPTGFISKSRTPQLAGVQCENCHGPAGSHAANPDDLAARPRLELAATVCGGCHTGDQHPTYEEWTTSEHAVVEPAVLQLMRSSRANIDNCGRCHFGSARLALLQGTPIPVSDLNVGIVCITCHDPHANHVWKDRQSGVTYTNQLRNPLASVQNYHTTGSFKSSYNANINVCAQCHNDQGATWKTSSNAPHQSPQYNFLLGSVGELATGSAISNPAAHAGLAASAQYSVSGTFYLTNQCVSCHMQPDAAPATTSSHTFTVDTYDVCLQCHTFRPDLLVQEVEVPAISNRVYALKYALDLWAATKAPAALRTNGVLAWEYTTPGGLMWQTNGVGAVIGWVYPGPVNFKGPIASRQALVPDIIKKARFNLYLVLGDGSYGVHNPFFAVTLLDTAEDWVLQALNQ